ncbi:MAG: glycerol-3-phosphate dehydrogenase/oxidase [Chloroflexota bacterium]
MSAPRQRREATLAALEHSPLDVLVIGGGIVGAGIARDLALRGLRVGLVEQHDLGSGTSSRPTRLIHGGLRYLEMLDFGLVRTDMREREILLRVAPHLVEPLPFLMPMYRQGWLYRAKLQAGMQLYDALSYDKSLPSRRWLSRTDTREREPSLVDTDLQGAWQFYDGQVALVERLVLENALDAAAAGALIANYARVTQLVTESDGAVCGARVIDVPTGRELTVRARWTVNASGPWLDRTNADVRPGGPPLLRLTKGVHLVTPSISQNAHVLFAKSDGRLFFVVPWRGLSLIGTTDTDYVGDPTDAEASEADVAYLQSEVRLAFPDGPVDEVLFTWAGVRALVKIDSVAEGKVSRKHVVHDHARRDGFDGMISVAGGKVTGYRAIAAEVGNIVSRRLAARPHAVTDVRALPGAAIGRDIQTYIESHLWPRAAALGLDREQVDELASTYGSLAHTVLDRVQANPAAGERLCPGQPAIMAQLERAVDDEWALTLGDVLLRRTPLGLTGGQALDCVESVAQHMAHRMGWDAATTRAQVAAYRDEVAPMRRFSAERAAA